MVTRLGLYGGSRGLYGSFAGKTPGVVVVPKGGGRTRRKKRYVVEVDGKFIHVNSISDAESILQQVRELADESAEKDVKTPVAPKPPKVGIKTGTGKATTSITLQRAVEQTQKTVTQAYTRAASRIRKEREVDREISTLMLEKMDEEENVIIRLLM